MSDSLRSFKRVPAALLSERLEPVRELNRTGTEGYELMKDTVTGEHYLVYDYIHLRIADGGKETYFHFLPLDHDDVLAVVLGEQSYNYPDDWTGPYLRNSGEDDSYVWFDASEIGVVEEDTRRGEAIREKLLSFKQGGEVSEEAIRKLLKELDEL